MIWSGLIDTNCLIRFSSPPYCKQVCSTSTSSNNAAKEAHTLDKRFLRGLGKSRRPVMISSQMLHAQSHDYKKCAYTSIYPSFYVSFIPSYRNLTFWSKCGNVTLIDINYFSKCETYDWQLLWMATSPKSTFWILKRSWLISCAQLPGNVL